MAKRRPTHPWHPLLWPTWAGLGVLWLISRLPWSWQRRLADVMGWVAFHLLRVRRHVVLTNLRLCFPELGAEERTALALRHYQSLSLGVLEVGRCWWRPITDLPPHRIEGLEHLAAARAKGKGVILLSGHFTTLEITARMLALQAPICCLYRDPNNIVLANLMRRHREDWTRRAIAMESLRDLLRSLRDGETLWYAPDQGRWTAQSSMLPFLGEPCITNTSASRLASMTGAAVITFYGRREADGSYSLTLSKPMENFPTDNPDADTLRIVAELEVAVRASPEQYLWVHRRFKRRGGEPSPYDR